MTSEVFYPKKHTIGSFVVNILHVDMITDIMTVEHKGQEYKLEWNPNASMYVGSVSNIEGYML